MAANPAPVHPTPAVHLPHPMHSVTPVHVTHPHQKTPLQTSMQSSPLSQSAPPSTPATPATPASVTSSPSAVPAAHFNPYRNAQPVPVRLPQLSGAGEVERAPAMGMAKGITPVNMPNRSQFFAVNSQAVPSANASHRKYC